RHQLHHQIDQVLGLAVIVDSYDVRVIEPRDHLHLAIEALDEANAILGVVGQDLDGNDAPRGGVLGALDPRGAAASDTAKDEIVSELAPDQLVPVHAQTILARCFPHARASYMQDPSSLG